MRVFPCSLLALCVLANTLQAASKDPLKDPPKDPPKEEPLVWHEHVTPGPAVTLRIKRNVGKPLIYEGTLERSQDGPSSYMETGAFYLNVLCANHSAADNLDEVAILRTFTDRKRTEHLENGKKKDLILENTNDLINLGPNFGIVGSLRCYKYDAQNRLAYRTQEVLTLKDGSQLYGSTLDETPDKVIFLTSTDKVEVTKTNIQNSVSLPTPHICINETPHYLFPILSGHAVSPGDTWKFKVPIIIPVEPISGQVLPTQFFVNLVGRLREVQSSAAGKVAIMDYQVAGIFDSQAEEYASRFTQAFANDNRVIHKVSGDGAMSIDVEKGRILSKSENFVFTLYAQASIPQGNGAPPKVTENKVEVTSRYDVKLLPPGTRLHSGAIVPEYDDK